MRLSRKSDNENKTRRSRASTLRDRRLWDPLDRDNPIALTSPLFHFRCFTRPVLLVRTDFQSYIESVLGISHILPTARNLPIRGPVNNSTRPSLKTYRSSLPFTLVYSTTRFTILRGGCICRGCVERLAQRNASPPPYSPPAQSSSVPDLNLARPIFPPELLRPPASSSPNQFAKEVAAVPPSPASSAPHTPLGSDAGQAGPSSLHPRVAVILGVDRRWYIPLLVCRALSTLPAAWWGLRCAFTFLAELLHIRPGMGREGWAAAIVGSVGQEWDVERRFRVTEVALAIMWCCASAYLSYFFADCMMSRWLLNYTPPAVVIRLLTTNGLIAYITSWVLYLSGASSDPRLLLPAWVSITTTLTFVYHATQNHATIKRETAASLLVVSVASFLSLSSLLLQLHLTRENEPEVPVFVITRKLWDWAVAIFLRMRVADDRVAGEL